MADVWSDDSSSEDEGILDDDELRARFEAGQLQGAKEPAERSKYYTIHKKQLDLAAIEAKLKEISALDKLPWAETLLVQAPEATEKYDAQDDFSRENAFYEQTLAAVVDARKQLKQNKIPVERPSDYYAEMLKTDEHMQHIKEKILAESKKIEASERARKQRDNLKFGKKVQQEVAIKRQKAKSEALAEAAKMRKGLQQKLANNNDVDFDVEASDATESKKNSGKSAAKRKAKDAKFGYGGSKNNSRSKRNNKDSFVSSVSHKDRFSVAKNKQSFANMKKKGAGKNARPGKSKRSASTRR